MISLHSNKNTEASTRRNRVILLQTLFGSFLLRSPEPARRSSSYRDDVELAYMSGCQDVLTLLIGSDDDADTTTETVMDLEHEVSEFFLDQND